MIHIFIGTKAQTIKMAPIMLELKNRGIPYNFIHSGQHHETISDILSDFDLPPPDFYITKHHDITRKIQVPKWMAICERMTRKNSACWKGRTGENDITLVHGDTFSTILGALFSKRAGLKCAHIESGLRSGNILHPFPEELVRMATFRLSDILFCPTEDAVKNVAHLKKKIVYTNGNTLLDATRLASKKSGKGSKDYGVVSIHRYENIFNKARLEWIINRVVWISTNTKVLFVLHPPTEVRLRETGLYEILGRQENIKLTNRVGYTEFVKLLSDSRFLITDGGSNQEECSYLGIPCLIMRKATERPEGLGRNAMLSNYDDAQIDLFFESLDALRHETCIPTVSPSKIIVDSLKQFYW